MRDPTRNTLSKHYRFIIRFVQYGANLEHDKGGGQIYMVKREEVGRNNGYMQYHARDD
jgi:hypothetical protein